MFYRKYCSGIEALHRNTRKGITILVFFIFLFLFSKKKIEKPSDRGTS